VLEESPGSRKTGRRLTAARRKPRESATPKLKRRRSPEAGSAEGHPKEHPRQGFHLTPEDKDQWPL